MLNGELFTQKLQVSLSAFVYRLLHEDFSPLVFTPMSGEKSS